MKAKVEKYKGEKALEEGMQQMLAAGWQIQNQAQRKQAYSLCDGESLTKIADSYGHVHGIQKSHEAARRDRLA